MIKELCSHNKITIQCHNNPDADTLASAYAMYLYFTSEGIDTTMIYLGNPIRKPNLRLMVSKLSIPIVHVDEPYKVEDLLLLVDCQYGESNVAKLEADVIAVIDHHNSKSDMSVVQYCDVQPQLGSCSTLVWKHLKEEGFFKKRNFVLETALYYGLMTDTENFVEAHHPLDLDMRDELDYDKMVISQFCNSNISLDELEVAGIALLKNMYNANHRYSVCQAKPCDPNVMGMIIDLVKTVDNIDTCVVFCDCGGGYKFSVRSCIGDVHANELAEYIADGIGSAGGHIDKAGGFCSKELFEARETSLDFESYVNTRIANYFDSTEVIKASTYINDKGEMKVYRKKKSTLGYVDPMEFVKEGENILIRTLEGDVNCIVDGSFYIIIGVLGEVYPIKKDKFERSYEKCKGPYQCAFEYDPILHTSSDGRKWDLKQYAKSCQVSEQSLIYARKLDNYAKVYTTWDYDSYMYGKPGDYLARRYDDEHDFYIIQNRIFDKTYDLV